MPEIGYMNYAFQDVKVSFGGYFLVGAEASLNLTNFASLASAHGEAFLNGVNAFGNLTVVRNFEVVNDADLGNWYIGQ